MKEVVEELKEQLRFVEGDDTKYAEELKDAIKILEAKIEEEDSEEQKRG